MPEHGTKVPDMVEKVSFWGCEVPPGKFSIVRPVTKKRIETIMVTSAALGEKPDGGDHVIIVRTKHHTAVVGTLNRKTCRQFQMDISLSDKTLIRHTGEGSVWLAGYMASSTPLELARTSSGKAAKKGHWVLEAEKASSSEEEGTSSSITTTTTSSSAEEELEEEEGEEAAEQPIVCDVCGVPAKEGDVLDVDMEHLDDTDKVFTVTYDDEGKEEEDTTAKEMKKKKQRKAAAAAAAATAADIRAAAGALQELEELEELGSEELDEDEALATSEEEEELESSELEGAEKAMLQAKVEKMLAKAAKKEKKRPAAAAAITPAQPEHGAAKRRKVPVDTPASLAEKQRSAAPAGPDKAKDLTEVSAKDLVAAEREYEEALLQCLKEAQKPVMLSVLGSRVHKPPQVHDKLVHFLEQRPSHFVVDKPHALVFLAA